MNRYCATGILCHWRIGAEPLLLTRQAKAADTAWNHIDPASRKQESVEHYSNLEEGSWSVVRKPEVSEEKGQPVLRAPAMESFLDPGNKIPGKCPGWCVCSPEKRLKCIQGRKEVREWLTRAWKTTRSHNSILWTVCTRDA